MFGDLAKDSVVDDPGSDPTGPVTAVVLGGGGGDALSRAAGVAAKALVPFAGRPLVSYVLEALRGCPAVAHIVYVGDAAGVVTAQVGRVLPPGETFVESFSVGVRAALELEPGRAVLVTTADLPWLRAEALDDFLKGAAGAALAYPVVEEGTARAQFPDQQRTFVRLRDGRFTGGNLMLVTPEMVTPLLPFVEHAYRGRKNPLALARLFGADFIVRLALGRLSLRAVERRAERILGLPVRAVVSEHASIGADVDKLEHLRGAVAG